jgi:hypothetical protein
VEAAPQQDVADGFNVPLTTVAASPIVGQVNASKPPAGQPTLISRLFRTFVRRWFSGIRGRGTGSESRFEKVRVIRNDLTEVEVEIIPGQGDSKRGFLGKPLGKKGKGGPISKTRAWMMARVFQGGPARL